MLKHVIIVEADPVVRMDLDEMLSVAFPQAACRAVDRNDAAVAFIEGAGKDTVIFARSTGARTVEELSDALVKAVEQGALVYLLGDPVAIPFPGRFIDLPFSQETIVSHLLTDLS